MPLELWHDYLHQLKAEAFRFKERQDDEVHIIVTYGPIGGKGSGGATELSVVLHPVQLDSCICRRSCYRAHALGDCPARWPRPNDVASRTESDTIMAQNPNTGPAALEKATKGKHDGLVEGKGNERTANGSERNLSDWRTEDGWRIRGGNSRLGELWDNGVKSKNSGPVRDAAVQQSSFDSGRRGSARAGTSLCLPGATETSDWAAALSTRARWKRPCYTIAMCSQCCAQCTVSENSRVA